LTNDVFKLLWFGQQTNDPLNLKPNMNHMKNITLLMISIILCISVYSQDDKDDPAKNGNRFFVGFSYSYLSIDMKLSALSLHSEWYGTDMGTHELTDEELDDVNSNVDRNTRVNYLNIVAGMSFIKNPGSKWHANGNVYLGIAGTRAEVQNTGTDSLEYTFGSDFSKPCLGLGFDAGYRFDDHWGLSVMPRVFGSISKTDEINDMVNPDPINFTSTKEDKNQIIYFRCDLLASYTTGPVTLYLGPGFYYSWSKHEYSREYIHVETGDVLIEKVNSTIVPRTFIDGSLAMEWKIIEAFTFNAHAGISRDLSLDAGIHFNF